MFQARAAPHEGQEVYRHHVHEVEQKHPAEDGEAQGREKLVGSVKSILDLVVDELDKYFHEILEFAGHAGRGGARGEIEGAYEKQSEHQRNEHAVPVDDG